MPTTIRALGARLSTLVKQPVKYTGWSCNLNEFVEKRLRTPRPTKVEAIHWLAEEPLLAPTEGNVFTLLDVGCGPGVFAQMLRRSELGNRVRYLGVDQSQDALAHARSTLPDGWRLERRDVLREGLPESPFDVVVVNEVVEHMPNYRDLLDAALARRPKVLVVTTFAVLPEQRKDRFLWNERYACYMNTYSFCGFYSYLREAGRSIRLLDCGSERDETAEFPTKALMLFYLPQR